MLMLKGKEVLFPCFFNVRKHKFLARCQFDVVENFKNIVGVCQIFLRNKKGIFGLLSSSHGLLLHKITSTPKEKGAFYGENKGKASMKD